MMVELPTTSPSPEPEESILWSRDFIVLDSQVQVETALEEVRRSTARWVVVRSPGPQFHVLRDEEVDRLPDLLESLNSLHLLRGTVRSALERIGSRESPVIAKKALLPGLLRDHPSPTTGTTPRCILADANLNPREIAFLSSDSGRRTRSATPRDRILPDADTEGVDESVAPNEANGPIRHPSISTDAPPRAGQPIAVTVDLKRQPDPSTEGGAMIFDAPADWTDLIVEFRLVCPVVEFKNPTGQVTVRRNQDSIPDVCHGVVLAELPAGTPCEITALFTHRNRFSGTAIRRLVVVDPDPSDPAPAGLPTSPTEGALLVEVKAEPPDLTVHIMVIDKNKPGSLHWHWTPKERFDGLPPKLGGASVVDKDPGTYIATQLKQFEKLEPGRHEAAILGFGELLWDKAPANFRKTYWAMWDRYHRALTIQFISDDPHIPWELMRPLREDGSCAHPILARKHSVARWIMSYESWMRNTFRAGGLFSIVPQYRQSTLRLSSIQAELAALKALGAKEVNPTYNSVLALLESGSPPEPVALLYFAGHGSFNTNSADASKIMLEDGSLTVGEVDRSEVKLGSACGPLVFFNACEVGATGSALGSVGGWADAFLHRHFGGFVGPLWAVDDEDAAQVRADLFDGILKKGEPIGEALRGVREKHGDRSPTFYSYLYYGDVNAKFTSG